MSVHRQTLVASALFGLVINMGSCSGTGSQDGSGRGGGGTEKRDGVEGPDALGSPAAPTAAPTTDPSADVGTIPGDAGSDGQGHAVYEITLEVPPGAAGMQPAIDLVYNSGAGDGPLGVGWQLGGFSAIERCSATLTDDGAWGPLRYDTSDPLCLDGVRLVPVEGNLGDPGTVYRTRRDGYVRVVAHDDSDSGNSWFEVQRPDGSVAFYGTSSGSQVRHGHVPLRWAIARVDDLAGNLMRYAYTKVTETFPTGAGDVEGDIEFLPDRIDYTENGGESALRSVYFGWAGRPGSEIVETWRFGHKFRAQQRLERVVTVAPPNAELVRRYEFSYLNASTSGRSLLNTIEECDLHARCKPVTQLEWEFGSVGYTDVPQWMGGGDLYDFQPFATTGTAGSAFRRVVADVNGDGAQDLVFAEEVGSYGGTWHIWLSPGPGGYGGEHYEINTGVPANALFRADLPDVYPRQPEMPSYAVDFNNDNLDDLVYLAGPPIIEDGSIFSTISLEIQVPAFDVVGDLVLDTYTVTDPSGERMYYALFNDLDGDGFADVLACRGPSFDADLEWAYALNVPDATAPHGRTFDFAGGGSTGVRCSLADEFIVIDYDGDGISEPLVVPALETDGTPIPDDERTDYLALEVDVSTGTGAWVPTGLPRDRYQRWRTCHNIPYLDNADPEFQAGSSRGFGTDKIVELNGDGLPDIVRFELAAGDDVAAMDDILDFFSYNDPTWECESEADEDGVMRVYWNTGNGFVAGSVLRSLDQRDQYWWLFFPATPADYDNDGRVELLSPEVADTQAEATQWAALDYAGNGAVEVPLGIAFHAISNPAERIKLEPLLDLEGNGSPDLALWYPSNSSWDLWTNDAVQPDLLLAITDGLFQRTEFVYEPAQFGALHHDDDPVTGFTGCGAPDQRAHCDLRTGPILRNVRYDNGRDDGGAVLEEQFDYWDPTVDRRGRGSLGFSLVRTTSRSTGPAGLYEIHDARQDNATFDATVDDFPFAGVTFEETVRQHDSIEYAGDSDYLIQRTTDVLDVVETLPGTGVYDVRLVHRDEETAEFISSCLEQWEGWDLCEITPTMDIDLAAAHDYEYDAYGNIWHETHQYGDQAIDELEVTRQMTNDDVDWVLGQVDRETTTSRSDMLDGSMLEETRVVAYEYDPATHLLDAIIREPEGADDAYLRIDILERDEHGNVTQLQRQDALSETRLSLIDWDDEGVFPTSITNEIGHVETFQYHRGLGVQTLAVDAANVAYETRYDGFGRPVLERRRRLVLFGGLGPSDGANVTTVYGIVPGTNRMRIDRSVAGGVDESAEYDRLGRPIRVEWETAQGRAARETEYGELMEVDRVSLPFDAVAGTPAGYWVQTHDLRGRLTSMTAPDGTSRIWRYQIFGNAEVVDAFEVDSDTVYTTRWIDPLGRVKWANDAAGNLTSYDWGPFTTLRLVDHDGALPPTEIDYDVLGRRTFFDEPATGPRTYGYNAWDDREWEVDALANLTTFEYDVLGRPTTRTDVDGTTTWEWDTTKTGLLGATHNPGDTVARTYGYDAYARLTGIDTDADSESFALGFSYDANSRPDVITYPDRPDGLPFRAAYEYAQDGSIERVTDDVGGAEYWRAHQRDHYGRIEAEYFGNGTSTSRVFDPLTERLTYLTTSNAGGIPLQYFQHLWWPNGQFKARIDHIHGQTEGFEYDVHHRVRKAVTKKGPIKTTVNAGYDRLGNITSRTDVGAYDYTPEGHLLTAGSSSYTFDANGRLESWTDGTTQHDYEYTAFGKLASATGAATTTYEYDADQTRVVRYDDGFLPSLNFTTVYLNDLFERRSGIFTPAKHTYNILADSGPVARIEVKASGEVTEHYLHPDHLGSVTLVTDDAGTVEERRSFDAWGDTRDPTDWTLQADFYQSSTVDFGFTGHRYKLDDGLIDMRGRMFDPKIGRFTTPDPFVSDPFDATAASRYAYVHNDPMGRTDPTGFCALPGDHDCLNHRVPPGSGGADGLNTSEGSGSGGGSRGGSPETETETRADGQDDDKGPSANGSSAMPGRGPDLGGGATDRPGGGSVGDLGPGAAIDGGSASLGGRGTGQARRGIRGGKGKAKRRPPKKRDRPGVLEVIGDPDNLDRAGMAALNAAGGITLLYTGLAIKRALEHEAVGDAVEVVGHAARAAELRPYGGPGGGHHVPAKAAFRGAPGYSAKAALAISNAELARQGVSHSAVTAAQQGLYRAFAKTGAPLTWGAIAIIEADALAAGGMAPDVARATVASAIQALKSAGVLGPTRIPWGG